MSKNIEAIIFDMGRVLVGINISKALEAVPGLAVDFSAVMDFYTDEDFIAFNCGKLTAEEFFDCATRKLGYKDLVFDDFKKIWTGIFLPHKGMEALVGEVKQKYEVGLLSDTDPLHWEYICNTYPWIKESFPGRTLSYEEGCLKPAAEIYHAACGKIGMAPEKCLFIGDRADNVDGAKAVGMSALQFTTPQKLREDLLRMNIL